MAQFEDFVEVDDVLKHLEHRHNVERCRMPPSRFVEVGKNRNPVLPEQCSCCIARFERERSSTGARGV
jgi:hypothetical protein